MLLLCLLRLLLWGLVCGLQERLLLLVVLLHGGSGSCSKVAELAQALASGAWQLEAWLRLLLLLLLLGAIAVRRRCCCRLLPAACV